MITVLAVACDQSNPAEPEISATPSFTVVDQWNSNGKTLWAYGYKRDSFYYPYGFLYYEVSVYDSKTSSGKSKMLYVYTTGYYPSWYCTDQIELTNKDFAWSMGKPWVKVETGCGLVDLTWDRTSEVFTGHYDYWTGATDNCSPPEGQYSWHVVSNGQWADADVSGTAGQVAVPVTGSLYEYNYGEIYHGTYHRK